MSKVENLTISCMDYRFRAGIAAWIDEKLDGQSDLVALAGASKAILDESSQPVVLNQIGLASQLHGIQTVHIIDHIDCGAYGGSAHYNGDRGAEFGMHQEQLGKAARVILSHFPGIKVETHIIDPQQTVHDQTALAQSTT